MSTKTKIGYHPVLNHTFLCYDWSIQTRTKNTLIYKSIYRLSKRLMWGIIILTYPNNETSTSRALYVKLLSYLQDTTRNKSIWNYNKFILHRFKHVRGLSTEFFEEIYRTASAHIEPGLDIKHIVKLPLIRLISVTCFLNGKLEVGTVIR